MTQPNQDPMSAQAPPGPTERGSSSDRSGTWMMFAMIVCCATIPIALLIAFIAGGVDIGAVSAWSWLLLAVAIAAASAMIARVSRGNR